MSLYIHTKTFQVRHFMAVRFPCPRCNRSLEPSGEIMMEGNTFLTYQCDECIVPWKVGDTTFEAAYTFAVDADGTPFDPNRP